MDYEEFYSALQAKEKGLKDVVARQKNTFNSMSRNTAKGDLKGLAKDMAAMDALILDHIKCLKEFREIAEGFDAKAYMQNGDFAEQMLTHCGYLGINVKGEYPVYEMFPYKVKIDGDSQDVYIDRKRVPCARPKHLVSDIKQSRDKLMKASFNATAFLNELADAYDKLTLLKRRDYLVNKHDLSLKDLHRFLTPMQRFRKDYDMQSFAFDLARLYASDAEFTSDGRQYRMGPARNQAQNIRILDKNGSEAWVGIITFYSN